ncbi:4'-phosphopantetheinyl transferase family protein [Yinghuangia sp. YIM S09857]|uniref:4'-phosphopantetheinyl transferase family protein n=1 Tax=Yinghuangia sp. YIM S09857 TaxID=3436929 RepID=UPI003F53A405
MSGEAESWLIDLRGDDGLWDDDACRAELSAQELRRADRLRPASARAYVRSRAAVRRVLARVLGGSPAGHLVAAAPDGTPVLPNHPDWHVSWSRSAGVLLVALNRGGPVGADVEAVRPVMSPARVLRRFSPDAAALGDVDGPEAFLSAWTLLEAAVKATGRGLAQGAGDVRLHRPPGARHCALLGIEGDVEQWSGRTDLFTLPGAVASAPPEPRAPGSAAPAAQPRVVTAVVVRGSAAPLHPHAWRLPEPGSSGTHRPLPARQFAGRPDQHVGAGSDAERNRPTLGRLEKSPC